MTSATYQRVSDVLWRSGADRVLARRVGCRGVDLLGATALVWVALDQPRSIVELASELGDLGIELTVLDAALSELLQHALVQVVV